MRFLKCVLIATVLFGSFVAVANEAKIESAVYSESKVNRFRRKEHPFKLGYCMGRDTEISDETLTNIVSSQDSSGKIVRNEHRGHPGISDFYFGAMEWNMEMGPQDVLKFSFIQESKLREKNKDDSQCNTTITQSHLLSQTSKLSGKMLIAVPQGIYVLRIRNVLQNSNISLSSFSTGFEVLNRETKMFKELNMPLMGDTKYVFVRPGDLVAINLSLETESVESVSFKMEYEVGFLGSYMCEDVISAKAETISKSLLMQALSTPNPTDAQIDKFIIKTSCLRNPLVTREMFMNSYGSDLAELLQNLSLLISKLEKSSNAGTRYFYQINLKLLTTEMSKNLLSDLKLFCEPVRLESLFGIPNDFSILARRYNLAALNYLKIKYTVDQTVTPILKQFVQYIDAFEKKGKSTADLNAEPVLSVLENYAEDVQAQTLINYSNLITLLSQVSGNQISANIKYSLETNLKEANQLSRHLLWEIKQFYQAVYANQPRAINASSMQEKISKLEIYNSRILSLIRNDLAWFENTEGDYTESKFTRDLFNINNRIMKILAQNIGEDAAANSLLREAIVEANPNYAPIFDLNAYSTLNNQVNKCLSSAKD